MTRPNQEVFKMTENITERELEAGCKAVVVDHGIELTVRIYKAGAYSCISSKTFAGCDRYTLVDKFVDKFIEGYE